MEIAQTVSVDSARTNSSSSSPSSPSPSAENEVNSNAPPRKYEIDDDEEGDVCRICRNPGDSENPLRYPCACCGSIKFVHQDCLLQWLNHSNARQCEGSSTSDVGRDWNRVKDGQTPRKGLFFEAVNSRHEQ